MSNQPIGIEYNDELPKLTKLLARVKRPGEFYSRGTLEVPMPRLEIEGVGTIAFPVIAPQAREIIQQSTLAPYGRGEATLVDTSVRNVWQIAPSHLSITGKTWAPTLFDF